MTEKIIKADCTECESNFQIIYEEEEVSELLPCFCPFCGERIEDIQEEYIDEDDLDEDEYGEWR